MNSKEVNVSRRQFLKAAGMTTASLPLTNAFGKSDLKLQQTDREKKYNVIYILSDDHRYDFMGFLGKPKFLETAGMDRMAGEGVYLEKAFVTTSLCSPSRASILTGQYPHKHGIVDNYTDTNTSLTNTFPEYLQKNGYQTAFIGKWHMGYHTSHPRPGFDKWISFEGQGKYYDCELNIDGKMVQSKGYLTDILTDYALEWLTTERDPNKPFFLFLSHKSVHLWFEPAQRHAGKYDDVTIEYPKSMADTEENYKGKPKWLKEQRNSWHGVDYLYHGAIEFDTMYKRYCETILALDESINRVIEHVDENNLSENTAVIYMGDNGFTLGEHGIIDKRHMYEESIRVPLLMWAPDLVQPGSKVTKMVQNIDIAPTILDLAGIAKPDSMDGKSFIPLVQDENVPWKDKIFYEHYWEWNHPHTPTLHGVRSDRFKYIHYYGIWDPDEFYDLTNDPEEMNNLIDDPAFQEILGSHKKALFDWMEQTGAMTIPLRIPQGVRNDKRKPIK